MHPMLIIAVRAARYTGDVVTFIRILLATLCCQVVRASIAKPFTITAITPHLQHQAQNKPLSKQCCLHPFFYAAWTALNYYRF